MNCLQGLLVISLCVAAAHGALYHQRPVAGGNETEAEHEDVPLWENTLGGMVHHGVQKVKDWIKNHRTISTANSVDTTQASVQSMIVDQVNGLRRQAGAANMAKLTWDDELAQKAVGWSNQCNFAHPNRSSTFLSSSRFSVGQNIAMGTGPMTWNQSIGMWYNEIKDFTFGKAPKNNAVVGHYTQLVWASTNKIGCGYTLCPAGKMTAQPAGFFVCNFGPAGNVAPGQYSPFQAGASCAKCPNACDDQLCTNSCAVTNDYSNCDVAVGSYPALFPSGNCASDPNGFANGCKATCQCKAQSKLY